LPGWLLCPLLSIILFGQAWINFVFITRSKDVEIKLFYCLDNPQRHIYAYINLVATLIYAGCLVYWMWLKDNNPVTYAGNS